MADTNGNQYMALNDIEAEELAAVLRKLLKRVVATGRTDRIRDDTCTENVYIGACCLSCDIASIMTGVADDVEDEIFTNGG